MKGIYLALVLIFLGTAEVAATGSLVNKLGLTNLIILYVVTTVLGGTILFLQYGLMKQFFKIMGESSSNEMSEKLKENIMSPEVKKFRSYVSVSILYSFAWALILVPGLVTDLVGFICLGLWFSRKKVVLEACGG